MFCGRHSISWGTMAGAADYMKIRCFDSLVDVVTNSLINLNSFAFLYQNNNMITLHYLLVASRFSLATDPRDHVYALLGLTSDAAAREIQPDYTKKVAEVFASVTIHIMQHEKQISILSAVTDSKWSKLPRLPSWVPDWASIPRVNSLMALTICSPGFEAATGSPRIRFSAGSQLHAIGYTIDTIKSLGLGLYVIEGNDDGLATRLNPQMSSEVMIYNLSMRLLTWERLAYSLTEYPTSEDVASAYQNAIIASQQLQGENLPSLADLYQALRMYWVSPIENLSFKSILDTADEIDRSAALLYGKAVWDASVGRRLCLTKQGYMGLVPTSTRRGDKITLLAGGKTPYVIRAKRKSVWTFLGDCYVHGVMNGECWNPDQKMQEFTFV